MASGGQSLCSKTSLLPPLLHSSAAQFNPLRRIATRTVRMASLDPSGPPPSSKVDSTSAATTATSSSDAAAGASSVSASSAIDFLDLCHRLKVSPSLFFFSLVVLLTHGNGGALGFQTTKRTGWVRRGIRDPESVADHMYRMGVMALIAGDIPGVDRDRLGLMIGAPATPLHES